MNNSLAILSLIMEVGGCSAMVQNVAGSNPSWVSQGQRNTRCSPSKTLYSNQGGLKAVKREGWAPSSIYRVIDTLGF